MRKATDAKTKERQHLTRLALNFIEIRTQQTHDKKCAQLSAE